MNMPPPKISVALAACRGEKFIACMIQSLLAQTLVPDEIIICDDSPDDKTMEAVAGFMAGGKVHYLHNDTQLGVCRNFEKAISCCSGDVIFLCDQDDVWLPQKISIMVQTLQENPAWDGVFCDSTVVDAELRPLGFTHWEMRDFSASMRSQMEHDTLSVMLKRIPAAAHNIAFRRRALDYLLPFPELPPFYPDTWIALQTAVHSHFGMVPQAMTLYRVHGDNVSAPQLPGLRTQIALSRKARHRKSIAKRMELAESVIARMPGNIPGSKREKVERFRQHYWRRMNFSRHIAVRFFQVMAEYVRGGYNRFSNGWKSAAADIFLT